VAPQAEERPAANANDRRRWARLLVAASALVIAVIVAGALFIGRRPGSEPGEPFDPRMLSEADQQDIAEMLIKMEMRGQDRTGICFISFGRETPPEFVARFLGCASRVKNVSEMICADGTVRDKATGEPGCVYSVHFERRIGSNEFIVVTAAVYGGLGGIGIYYRVKKSNGKWIAEPTGESWIS
jgi:hypothetical protein